MADDRRYEAIMKKALRLARRAEGQTSPNPMVGAVVFDTDGIISAGYHRRAGMPHAEVEALRKAGDRARGAMLAVTLEPCCHIGRTPPCTDAIINAGISRVIFAIEDSNPRVSGQGARVLKQSGIDVISGVMADEARRLNEVYLKFIETGRPFIALKLAQTLDGRIATRTLDSKWITSEKSRAFGHRLRALYDAIAVGGGTVRADNPSLRVVHVKGDNPLRIVVTNSLTLPKNANIFTDAEMGQTVIATGKKPVPEMKTIPHTIWPVGITNGRVSLKGLLQRAARESVTSILVEGGSELATGFLKQKLVDKMYLFTAPKIIGEGISSIGNLGITKISRSISFRDATFKLIGPDCLFIGYPEWN